MLPVRRPNPTRAFSGTRPAPRPNSAKYLRSPVFVPAPQPFRLTFLLPAELQPVPAGRHQPTGDGCILDIDLVGMVRVLGPSRGQVFDHVTRFLRNAGRGKPATTFIATLSWPPGSFAKGSHETKFSFAVGADVSWAPTSLGAEIARA